MWPGCGPDLGPVLLGNERGPFERDIELRAGHRIGRDGRISSAFDAEGAGDGGRVEMARGSVGDGEWSDRWMTRAAASEPEPHAACPREKRATGPGKGP